MDAVIVDPVPFGDRLREKTWAAVKNHEHILATSCMNYIAYVEKRCRETAEDRRWKVDVEYRHPGSVDYLTDEQKTFVTKYFKDRRVVVVGRPGHFTFSWEVDDE